MREQIVEALKKIPKVKAVGIISKDGTIVGDSLGDLGAKVESIWNDLRDFAEKFGKPLSSAQIDLQNQLLILEDTGGDVLVILGEKAVNIGRIRLELRKILKAKR